MTPLAKPTTAAATIRDRHAVARPLPLLVPLMRTLFKTTSALRKR